MLGENKPVLEKIQRNWNIHRAMRGGTYYRPWTRCTMIQSYRLMRGVRTIDHGRSEP